MTSDEGGSALSGSSDSGNDWAAQATAKVDEVVSIVRDKTVRPVSRVVKFLIFGLLAGAVGTLLGILFSIGVIRVLDTEIFHRRVWASYLIVGGIFSGLGLLLSSKRQRRR